MQSTIRSRHVVSLSWSLTYVTTCANIFFTFTTEKNVSVIVVSTVDQLGLIPTECQTVVTVKIFAACWIVRTGGRLNASDRVWKNSLTLIRNLFQRARRCMWRGLVLTICATRKFCRAELTGTCSMDENQVLMLLELIVNPCSDIESEQRLVVSLVCNVRRHRLHGSGPCSGIGHAVYACGR